MKAEYVLHSFSMGDVEDVEIYVAELIYQWQQTDHGKWCVEKATDPTFNIILDPMNMGHRVVITGYLSGKHATFWALKRT